MVTVDMKANLRESLAQRPGLWFGAGLVVVVLAIVAGHMPKVMTWRAEQGAAAQIRLHGGGVWRKFREGEYPWPSSLHSRLWPALHERVEQVNLRGASAADGTVLAYVARFAELEILCLAGTAVCDDDLALLRGLGNLRYLDIGDTRISDEGVATLGALTRLQMLDLSGTRVTDDGLVHLTALTRLETVHLERSHVTAWGVQALQAHLPRATVIHSVRLQDARLIAFLPLRRDPRETEDETELVKAMLEPYGVQILCLTTPLQWDILVDEHKKEMARAVLAKGLSDGRLRIVRLRGSSFEDVLLEGAQRTVHEGQPRPGSEGE